MSDANDIGGLGDADREQRNKRPEYRARTFIVGGTIASLMYVPPIHFADDVTVVGVAHKLRTGTTNIDMFLHDDESFVQTYAVTSTNTPVFDAFAEDLEAGELLRIAPYGGSSAVDLSFTVFYI